MRRKQVRIGIDLGGTKIEGVLLDAGGRELRRRRIATPGGDYDATLGAICDLVRWLGQGCDEPPTVGVGTPGTEVPASGLIKNANSVVLNGRSLRRDLEHQLGQPVRLANDANCFAVSEAVDGAGAGQDIVFGVILGTGVGGGVVVHGRPLAGAAGLAGEWGHNPLPWAEGTELPGPPCYCGKAGCIETFLSGGGLAADFRRAGGDALPAERIVQRADEDDPLAQAALRRYESRLARALASVINILDPDVIVLGGGLGKVSRWYRSVPALLPRHVFGGEVASRLVPPRHGDAGGVRGAAWLWPDRPRCS